MNESKLHVLSVGATGSIGRHVVAEALRRGHTVRALVRNARRATMPAGVEVVEGQLTDPGTLAPALEGIDAIVFTMGSHGGPAGVEAVDYGAVKNVLDVLDGRRVRIALMTAIGVTYMDSDYNRSTQAHDWKRRSERLVRASGNEYTIVRPGWFDYNDPDQMHLEFLQGDTRRNATAEDGVVSRRQIAQVLVDSLTCPQAAGKTLELVAVHGTAQTDLTPLFAALDPDTGVDGVRDEDNFPLDAQPQHVRDDLERIAALGR